MIEYQVHVKEETGKDDTIKIQADSEREAMKKAAKLDWVVEVVDAYEN